MNAATDPPPFAVAQETRTLRIDTYTQTIRIRLGDWLPHEDAKAPAIGRGSRALKRQGTVGATLSMEDEGRLHGEDSPA